MRTTTQTENPGKYNIGQQGRVIKFVLRKHCSMPPYLKLVNQCKDEHGFVTIRAVKTWEDGERQIDIGNFLGGVWIPFEAIVF